VNELTKQNNRAWYYEISLRCLRRLWRRQEQYEDAMPTFIRLVAELEEPAEFLSDEFRAAVLFGGIGLLVMLIAACTGVQGVWL
jgi:hypothetical protein